MISLILATLGRYEELDRCIESILSQINVEYEILVIDQNRPEFLSSLREKYSDVRIVWKNISTVGLSNARNEGLALARYNRIALIDDDSVLQNPRHLQNAISWLERYDFVSGICIDFNGVDANKFFPTNDVVISSSNIFSCIISPCFFFNVKKDALFDIRLGVGAYFGSGEETDFAITLIISGGTGYFTRSLSVIHPEGDGKQLSKSRRYKYALGVGALMRKRSLFFGPSIVIRKMLGPLLTSLKHLSNGKLLHAKLSVIDFLGRVHGYLAFR